MLSFELWDWNLMAPVDLKEMTLAQAAGKNLELTLRRRQQIWKEAIVPEESASASASDYLRSRHVRNDFQIDGWSV